MKSNQDPIVILDQDLKSKNKSPETISVSGLLIGPSGETWTHDPLTPSQVRYQLRYTRIFVADVHESACIY